MVLCRNQRQRRRVCLKFRGATGRDAPRFQLPAPFEHDAPFEQNIYFEQSALLFA
jgi:hypothetical protein